MSMLMELPPQAGALRPQSLNRYELRGELALSISFHEGDFRGAQILLDTIELMESMKHVDVLLSIMGGAESLDQREWMDFHQKATIIFRKVYVNKVRMAIGHGAVGNTRDWRPNNLMFRGVADYFATLAFHKKRDKANQIVDDVNNPYIGAFYYMEPDCAILKKDWFSQLYAEYKNSHKPFLGAFRDTARLVKDNRKLPPHINGSAIYPNPVVNFDRALIVAAMNDHPEAAPFDVLAGPTVVPQAKLTKLIHVEFGSIPNATNEAVIWHGDKQYQTNLTTIENGTGISLVRPHFQNSPSSELEEMPQRIHTTGYLQQQPTVAEALTGMPTQQAYDEGYGSQLQPNEFQTSSEILRAKAARIMAQADAREKQEKEEAQHQANINYINHARAQGHQEIFGNAQEGQLVLTKSQLQQAVQSLEVPSISSDMSIRYVTNPVSANDSSQGCTIAVDNIAQSKSVSPKTEPTPVTPKKPEQIYREILADVGLDSMAWVRACKAHKAAQKKTGVKKKAGT